jgi:hypothetical protein
METISAINRQSLLRRPTDGDDDASSLIRAVLVFLLDMGSMSYKH